ncbi:MAG: ecdysteroid 22-kinase family protein [Chloroflexota bacterium]|nr:ecdysteroid 22-kinase family protein [Chloroflexota bacterium]
MKEATQPDPGLTAQFIPHGPAELTPAWLTDVLTGRGHLASGAAVAAVEQERIGEGVGFIGEIVRLKLRYTPEGAGPVTIIAKFPSPDPGSRAIGNMYGLYGREVSFYRDLAATCGVPTATCYFEAMDADADRYVLLLEDLSVTGRIGDQVAGCSLEQAALALSQLARLHATWWASPRLAAIPWLQRGTDLVRAPLQTVYPALCARSLELFGDELTAEIRAVIPTLHEKMLGIFDEIDQGDMTLAHGDYRLDNLFFGHGSGNPLSVVDWQSPNIGWAAYDVAYFMCGSLTLEMRREHETAILRAYHDALIAFGVKGYDFERFFLDYRRSLLAYLAIFVINGATLEMSNQRAVDLFQVIFERLVGAITDLRALELLPE